jgi:hypothetical protein
MARTLGGRMKNLSTHVHNFQKGKNNCICQKIEEISLQQCQLQRE